MAAQAIQIDLTLAKALVASQFPHWANLPLTEMPYSGWDNRTFLLGTNMVVRLPRAEGYESQVDLEQRWLPHLRPCLPLEIPEPLARGRPELSYPWAWSIYRWIAGDTAAMEPVDMAQFAADLAAFLNALRAVPADGGPAPGPHNFHRGAALDVYDGQFRQAIAALAGQIDSELALAAWSQGLASDWIGLPVWVHGDIALGNLLVRGGKLVAVIDFGQVCVGDPACDLAIAWTYFRGRHRESFRMSLGLDDGTWLRGRAWALWKAAIVAAGLAGTSAVESKQCRATLEEILRDAARTDT